MKTINPCWIICECLGRGKHKYRHVSVGWKTAKLLLKVPSCSEVANSIDVVAAKHGVFILKSLELLHLICSKAKERDDGKHDTADTNANHVPYCRLAAACASNQQDGLRLWLRRVAAAVENVLSHFRLPRLGGETMYGFESFGDNMFETIVHSINVNEVGKSNHWI
jgi:hypothetical protein